jgi:hypothetical protein
VIDQPPDQAPLSRAVRYTERLRTPWWWYLAALVVAALLGAEFALAFNSDLAWIPLGILVPLCLLVVWRLSSGRITLTETSFTAGEHTVPLSAIDRVIGLTQGELRRLVGRHADPTATTFIRSWIGPGVQVVLRDPADSTPYWVVSTRHPERLLTAFAGESVTVLS